MEQKNNKTTMIIAAVEAVVSVFMVIAVTKIAPVCSGMLETATGKQVHMKCYYTGVVFVFLGILLLINAIVLLVSKQKLACGIMTVALAVFVFLTLNESIGIGICANTDMACQMTVPYARICATVALLCGAVSTFSGIKEQK